MIFQLFIPIVKPEEMNLILQVQADDSLIVHNKIPPQAN